MIKAILTRPNGKPIILLGLSRGNIVKLTAGQPMLIQGSEVGFPQADITIMFGETEQAIKDEITAALGPAQVDITLMG